MIRNIKMELQRMKHTRVEIQQVLENAPTGYLHCAVKKRYIPVLPR